MSYPDSPGYKEDTTSRDAAEAFENEAHVLRQMVVASLRDRGPATADTLARSIGRDRLAVRPRVSELRAAGAVFDTGKRGVNVSGKKAIIWDLMPAAVEPFVAPR